jgi:hypothetical protein
VTPFAILSVIPLCSAAQESIETFSHEVMPLSRRSIPILGMHSGNKSQISSQNLKSSILRSYVTVYHDADRDTGQLDTITSVENEFETWYYYGEK